MDSSPTPFLQSGHNPHHHHRRSSSTLSYGGGLPFYQGGRREPGQGQQGQDHVGRLSSSFDRKLYVDVNKSLSSSMDGKGSVNYLNSVGLNHNDDDGHLVCVVDDHCMCMFECVRCQVVLHIYICIYGQYVGRIL